MRPAVLSFLSLPAFVAAGVHEVWFDITYVDGVTPDGLGVPRRAIGVNGTWPPPPVEVAADDFLIVHATNRLDKTTSIHHHGMFFNSTPWMDGAVGVTECGIPPGQSFDYTVPINSSGQWGTYWWHAHTNGQYPDGLRAPLIIHNTEEHYHYDDEFTVVLGDWYHEEHSTLLDHFISIANPGGAEPVPDSGLLYYSYNGTYLAPKDSTTGTGFNENATLPFQPGKTYRLRIINTSTFAAFYFWIDGHDMRLIEADGTDIEENPVDLINISAAQRYSILVTARNDTVNNWAVHANMDTDMFDTIPDALNPNVTSSITYSGSAPLNDNGFRDEYHDIEDISLVPVVAISQPNGVTKTIELEVIFDTMSDGTNHGTFNSIVYREPPVPALFSELSLGVNSTVPAAYGPATHILNHLDVVDIVIKNADAGKHPFHLHGHKFQIVSRSSDYTSTDPELNPPLAESQPNPMRRDTVMIPSGGSVTMRFIADNPGTPLLHCHIEWHLQAGLAVVFLEAPEVAGDRFSGQLPQIMKDHCQTLGLPYSGNAVGKASGTDLQGLVTGPFPQNLGWHSKGIGAMAGCVLTAVLGMASVVWYVMGGQIDEEEIESRQKGDGLLRRAFRRVRE